MLPNKARSREKGKKRWCRGKHLFLFYISYLIIVSPFVSGNAMPTPSNMLVVTLRLSGESRLLRKRSMSVEKEFNQHKHLPHLLPVLAKTTNLSLSAYSLTHTWVTGGPGRFFSVLNIIYTPKSCHGYMYL